MLPTDLLTYNRRLRALVRRRIGCCCCCCPTIVDLPTVVVAAFGRRQPLRRLWDVVRLLNRRRVDGKEVDWICIDDDLLPAFPLHLTAAARALRLPKRQSSSGRRLCYVIHRQTGCQGQIHCLIFPSIRPLACRNAYLCKFEHMYKLCHSLRMTVVTFHL